MGLTVKDIYDFINGFAPFDTQCEWDNSGLLIGNMSDNIEKIAVVLDITPEAVEYAAEKGADLIISHHPVIFKPISEIKSGDAVYLLIRNGISAICAHTCLDKAIGGVNDALFAKLGFSSAPLCETGEASMLRKATVPPVSGEALARLVSDKLGAPVRIADCGKQIKSFAMCGGSGSDFIKDAIDAGCDALITGDASHHDFLDAVSSGITLIAAGHFATENPVVEVLADKLSSEFNIEIFTVPQSAPEKLIY